MKLLFIHLGINAGYRFLVRCWLICRLVGWLAMAKKASMPTQIKTDSESERIKSIISRKLERELPLIAEF
jgi:hypothetical protein